LVGCKIVGFIDYIEHNEKEYSLKHSHWKGYDNVFTSYEYSILHLLVNSLNMNITFENMLK